MLIYYYVIKYSWGKYIVIRNNTMEIYKLLISNWLNYQQVLTQILSPLTFVVTHLDFRVATRMSNFSLWTCSNGLSCEFKIM